MLSKHTQKNASCPRTNLYMLECRHPGLVWIYCFGRVGAVCLKVQELRPKLLQPTPPDPNHAGLYTRKHTHTHRVLDPLLKNPKKFPKRWKTSLNPLRASLVSPQRALGPQMPSPATTGSGSECRGLPSASLVGDKQK